MHSANFSIRNSLLITAIANSRPIVEYRVRQLVRKGRTSTSGPRRRVARPEMVAPLTPKIEHVRLIITTPGGPVILITTATADMTQSPLTEPDRDSDAVPAESSTAAGSGNSPGRAGAGNHLRRGTTAVLRIADSASQAIVMSIKISLLLNVSKRTVLARSSTILISILRVELVPRDGHIDNACSHCLLVPALPPLRPLSFLGVHVPRASGGVGRMGAARREGASSVVVTAAPLPANILITRIKQLIGNTISTLTATTVHHGDAISVAVARVVLPSLALRKSARFTLGT